MIDAAHIRWPGVDRQRAVAAMWHLERAVHRLHAFRLAELEPWSVPGRVLLRQASEHARIARGYLGAVGFECKARIW